MIRRVIWAVGTLMLAGVVHIVTVFGVPSHAVRDPWVEIGRVAPVGRFVEIGTDAQGRKAAGGLDPAMRTGACRFALDKGPVRLKASPPDVYWSLNLHDRRGLHVWGLDNRAAVQRSADVVVATDVQVARLRENPPEELEDVVIVEWKGTEGIAFLQVFRQQASLAAEIGAALTSAECTVVPLP